jgi:tryptophan synthase alpha chain
MSRLSEIFKKSGKCFIPFLTAGFPDMERCFDTALKLAESGAGIIELGVPFSDPIADGPIIQKSSSMALENGYKLKDVLYLVSEIRKRSDVGLVLMSYSNPINKFGYPRFENEAIAAGLDGLLLSDISIEEYLHLKPLEVLAPIFLVAPTSSPARMKKIADAANGFIYLISRTGVTGNRTDFNTGLPDMVERMRDLTKLPLAVGFGVTCKEDIKAVFQHADGAVVGSAIVKFMLEHHQRPDLPELTQAYVEEQIFDIDLLQA